MVDNPSPTAARLDGTSPPCPVCAAPCLVATAEYREDDDEIRAAPVRLYPAHSGTLEAWRLGPCGHRILADAYTLEVGKGGGRFTLNAGGVAAHVTGRPEWIPAELTFPACPQCGAECAWLEPSMPEMISHHDPVRGLCVAVDLSPSGWLSVPCGHVMLATEWHLSFPADGRGGEWVAGALTVANVAEHAERSGTPIHPAILDAIGAPHSPTTSSAPAPADAATEGVSP